MLACWLCCANDVAYVTPCACVGVVARARRGSHCWMHSIPPDRNLKERTVRWTLLKNNFFSVGFYDCIEREMLCCTKQILFLTATVEQRRVHVSVLLHFRSLVCHRMRQHNTWFFHPPVHCPHRSAVGNSDARTSY